SLGPELVIIWLRWSRRRLDMINRRSLRERVRDRFPCRYTSLLERVDFRHRQQQRCTVAREDLRRAVPGYIITFSTLHFPALPLCRARPAGREYTAHGPAP